MLTGSFKVRLRLSGFSKIHDSKMFYCQFSTWTHRITQILFLTHLSVKKKTKEKLKEYIKFNQCTIMARV